MDPVTANMTLKERIAFLNANSKKAAVASTAVPRSQPSTGRVSALASTM